MVSLVKQLLLIAPPIPVNAVATKLITLFCSTSSILYSAFIMYCVTNLPYSSEFCFKPELSAAINAILKCIENCIA